MIDRNHALPITRQAKLVGVSRNTVQIDSLVRQFGPVTTTDGIDGTNKEGATGSS